MRPSSRDVHVDLWPTTGDIPRQACVFVKRSHVVLDGGMLEAAGAPALVHDRRGDGQTSPVPQGSDLIPGRSATDVVVLGSAHAPEGHATREMTASCRVGGRTKSVSVFGRRFIEWSRDGRPFIGAPEAFTEMPLTREHAYGGIDTRVPIPDPESLEDILRLAGDHPGMYPRNPFGKGYFVVPERFDGIELPNLEDPDDLLTAERLVVGDPRSWHRQPLPWSFDWLDLLMFPRYTLLGAQPWFPIGEGGESLADTRGLFGDRAFHQEASLGMCFPYLEPGTPIELEGMQPDGRVMRFEVPAPPVVDIQIESHVERSAARPTLVVIRPDERSVEITYVATTTALPRTFIPGLHRHIPLSARIDGERCVAYHAPETIHDRLVAAGIRQAAGA